MDRCILTVQPAGAAGQRHVFLTVSGNADTEEEIHIDLVFTEQGANRFGDALISGSAGVMRTVDL